MKYYIIAGEASGDLHAAGLMRELKRFDTEAKFMFIGGDKMAAEGGIMVNHYRNLAYMGFIPVLFHLHTIHANMNLCKRDIAAWKPDVVILVDYPGFNLAIAKFVKRRLGIPVYYYISPKIWAWKEYRIKNIKRDVAEMFSILPFEVPFYEGKHHYKIHYVGNPTAFEVSSFRQNYDETFADFCAKNSLSVSKPVIALLAGSRKQEIKDNLPAMIKAASRYLNGYQLLLAGAPSISGEYYSKFLNDASVSVIYDQTFALLSHSVAALVTSGTATLETALLDVPQVVCYETPIPKIIAFLRKRLIKVKYISLVNLIADKTVVQELVADTFTVENIAAELGKILPEGSERAAMLEGYAEVRRALGSERAPENAARIMTKLLGEKANGAMSEA